MNIIDDYSKNIRNWGIALKVIGFIGILIGVVMGIMGEGWLVFELTFAAFFIGILLKGLYPISLAAEYYVTAESKKREAAAAEKEQKTTKAE